jgi:hypothetical protein
VREAVAGEGGSSSPTARSDDPDAAELVTAARAALRAKTGAAQTVRGDRVGAGRLQLCPGRDLRWYPYARSDQDWEPNGSPDPGPARGPCRTYDATQGRTQDRGRC